MQYKIILLLSFFILAAATLPLSAHAQTVSAQTQSAILCHAMQVGEFKPFVYNGILNSFEYTAQPGDYPVTPTIFIGNVILSPHFTSVWTKNGKAIYHVDVPSWISTGNPVSVKITQNIPGCARDYMFSVELPRQTQVITPRPQPVVPAMPPAPIDLRCTERDGVLDLEWSTSQSSGDHFVLKRGEKGSDPKTIIPQLPPNVRGFTDPLVEPGVLYSYQVDLMRAGVVSGSSKRVDCSTKLDQSEVPATTTSTSNVCTSLPLGIWVGLLIIHIAVLLGIIGHLEALLKDGGSRFIIALCLPFFIFCGLWIALDTCRAYPLFPALVAFLTLLTLVTPNLLKNK